MGNSDIEAPVVSLAGEQRGLYTAQSSTVVRTLALSGLAAVWLFGGGLAAKDSSPQVVVAAVLQSGLLRGAAVLAILALLCDALHYLWGSWAWGRVSWALNQALINDDYGRSPSADVTKAWRNLDRWGFANNLVHHAELGATDGASIVGSEDRGAFDSPVAEARQYLRTQPRPAVVTAFVSQRWSPPWLNQSTEAFFWLKASLAVGCYVCLLVYLV